MDTQNSWTANSGNWQEAQNFSVTSSGGAGGTNLTGWIGDPITYPATNWTYPYVYHYYYQWWYPSVEVRYEKSKIDLAFKIVKILIDKKIINEQKLTVGTFITIVNDLAKEI